MAKISILIKALNEERRIGACLESALLAIQGLDGEVILIDSLSSDRTVEIASRFPVRIVQFEHIEDRGCGAAVQLGFQAAQGEFIYLLDGDMILLPGFLSLALARLQADAGLAGVGGRLLDRCLRTEPDRHRAREAMALDAERAVRALGGGGLYRRSAIEQVGYMANRWLAACEEAELGARLDSRGWRLLRLPVDAIEHEGHQENSRQTLGRLWRNGRARASGVFLRSAWNKPWWPQTLRDQRALLLVPTAPVMGVIGALLVWKSLGSLLLALLVLPLPLFCWWFAAALRKRSIGSATWSLISIHMLFVAAIGGFMAKPQDPHAVIAARTLK